MKTKTRKIKFIVNAVKWFDRVNGNTYHSCRCTRVRDGKQCTAPFQYGYGSQYEYSAFETMVKAGWIKKYKKDQVNTYQMENNYPILFTCKDGLKRDCTANGTL